MLSTNNALEHSNIMFQTLKYFLQENKIFWILKPKQKLMNERDNE